ncbi:MAG: hypothetical protein M1829_005628 [Trizodia sp. TS-e1964]|nr:MAG: hypothetical protein M1829_005628 [Trizodia sp. TS-e1964]
MSSPPDGIRADGHLARVPSPAPSQDAPAELSAVVDELLGVLTTKFASVAAEVMGKSMMSPTPPGQKGDGLTRRRSSG